MPNEPIVIAKGRDGTIEISVFASDGYGKPVQVVLTADAAASATSLSVRADHPSIADDDVFLFGENIIVQASAATTYGDTSFAVDAIAGPLKAGMIGRKLQVLTGYTIEAEVLTRRDDASPVISFPSGDITIPTQSTITNTGRLQIALVAADTSSLETGSYYGVVWKRDSGTSRPLWSGTVKIEDEGFQ